MSYISIIISRRHGYQNSNCLAVVVGVGRILALVTSLICCSWRIYIRLINYLLQIGCIKVEVICVEEPEFLGKLPKLPDSRNIEK